MRTARRFIRCTALIALLAAIATTTTAWHVAEDDFACAVRPGDGGPDRLDPPASDSLPQHCFLCHWNRWVRSLPADRSESAAPGVDAGRVIPRATLAADRSTLGLVPGRSPPA